MRIHSFDPISRRDARLLILGTMPGKDSLKAKQYYAHPRNAFWKIMETNFNIPMAMLYADKTQTLKNIGIAIWDVLHTCTRESSLDSDIDPKSIIPNDFHAFFQKHPAIKHVYFNGEKAESLFMIHIHPQLKPGQEHLSYKRLPSTSPANARLTLEKKIKAWGVITLSS